MVVETTFFVPLKMITTTLTFLFAVVTLSKSLECGLSVNQGRDDLMRVTNVCMRSSNNSKNESNDKSNSPDDYGSNEYYESSNESNDDSDEKFTNRGNVFRKKIKRNSKDSNDDMTTRNNNQENDNNTDLTSNTEITNNCVVQCIFKNLNMVNADGFPDHNKISQILIGNTDNQELKDFFQDSTDVCFQLLENDDNVDACKFSTKFIKCLAEKGRSNCADWPIGDLPFSHMF